MPPPIAIDFVGKLDCPTAWSRMKFCNSYDGLPTLVEMGFYVDPTTWLNMWGEEWASADNVGEYIDDLLDHTPFALLAESPAAWRHHFMSEEDRDAFASLPDTLIVYRGCYESNKWGVSWSLDEAIARAFPLLHRFRQEGQPLLVKGRISKMRVLGLKLDRNELEIVTLERPKHVSTRHIYGAGAQTPGNSAAFAGVDISEGISPTSERRRNVS